MEVCNDVKWVGVLDPDLVTFDIVMETQYGTTYNSYFINADKKAVVETVKEKYNEKFLENIRQYANPEEIEVIVVNHTEPDHSGSLSYLLEAAPNATVYGSRQAINYLKEMMNVDFKSEIVKDGDEIDLGNKTLKIISAPNLHWPDSMYTYLKEEKVLFTCDSFGAHYANEKMFDDLVGDYSDAFMYYFDVILKPYSKFMLQAINKISELDILMACPGHGPILRSTWKEKVEKSKVEAEKYMAKLENQNRILITYVSAYGYTKQMAGMIGKGIKEAGGYEIDYIDLEEISPAEIDAYIMESKAMLIGSPTLNKNTLLQVYQMFAFINPIRDKGKKVAVFGSYGWSGEACGLIETILQKLNLDVVMDCVRMKFQPGEEKEKALIEYGKDFVEKLK